MAQRRRRQYGTGSVTQRKDGKWVGRIDAGFTSEGKRRVRSVVRSSESEAKNALKLLVREVQDNGGETGDARTSVKHWCTQWLSMRHDKVRPATFASDKSAVNHWIIPTIGKRRLADLSPADLRKIDKAVRDANRSTATSKRARDVLTLALKAAILEGHTVPQRVLMVESPAAHRSDRTSIPVEDAIALLKASEGTPDRSRWVAALLQGMRQGECQGLTWDRVDLEAGVVDIGWQAQELVAEHGCEGTCGRRRGGSCPERRFHIPDGYEAVQIHGRWHWTRPKTEAGERPIPLLPWMVVALRQWKDEAPASPHGLVWPSADGGVREDAEDRDAFKALQETAGVQHPNGRAYHVHEARHATATMLLALGVDTQIIIAIMGHSSVLSTRRYQHADLKMMRTALEGVAQRLELTA
ncbi:tyrosine-type recombinase/integrase [Brachybacterium subflavum]|uniref:tyrosine-type recombinase/integrase n=1 Tax=Brachybacterium subflavum TaxID=2585206 RepID=UPI00187A7E54|nr:site-specific integrase [Brachybacterium subflavum]